MYDAGADPGFQVRTGAILGEARWRPPPPPPPPTWIRTCDALRMTVIQI